MRHSCSIVPRKVATVDSDVRQIQPNIRIYFLALVLVAVGFVIFYSVFRFPGVENYPYVRLAAGAFGAISVVSGVGIWTKRYWVRWSLSMLLFSIYVVLGTTSYATGEISTNKLIFAVIVLPIAAILFWRAVRASVNSAT